MEEGEEECYYTSRKLYQHNEVQLQEEADCNEAIWCKLVTGHTTVTIGVVIVIVIFILQQHENINIISK